MSDARQVKITPETVEGFTLVQPLGQGATGSVFKAKRISDGQVFAVKLIFPALAKKPDFNEKFVRLAQISGKVDHPNIVKSIASGVSNGFHYVIMEYVEGKTLENVLSRGAMDEQRALQIALAIARALVQVQAAGLVHRDVKPANILLPRGGEAKLADLGLAVMATNPKVVGGATGTPHYMSPEAARSDANVDVRSDVYSLGATLFQMLTGQTMFTYGNVAEVVAAHLSEQAKPAHKVNATVSKGASKLVQRMTEKKAADRPWPADAVNWIEALLRGEKPFDTAGGRPPRGKPAETEPARMSKDSPTPAMPPPALQLPLPPRQSTPFEETIAAPRPAAGGDRGVPPSPPPPGRPPAGYPSPYPPAPPVPPPPPGQRTPSTAYPTPTLQPPGPAAPYAPPGPVQPPWGAPPKGYPPPPYPPPQAYPPPPYGYPPPPQGYPPAPPPYPPPQGYPPPPSAYPPPQGYPPAAPPPGPPATPHPPPPKGAPAGGKPGKKPPKGKRQIGRRWGDLI